jgi:hypothetical protein
LSTTSQVNLQKCTPDNLGAVFRREFTTVVAAINKFTTLHQAVVRAAPEFDAGGLTVSVAMRRYSEKIAGLIVGMLRANQALRPAFVKELPAIRRQLLETGDVFALLAQPFQQFVEPFLGQLREEMETTLLDCFKKDVPTVDRTKVSLFFEQAMRKVDACDQELLEEFRPMFVAIAVKFRRLRDARGALRQREAPVYDVVLEGMKAVAAKLSHETESQVVAALTT